MLNRALNASSYAIGDEEFIEEAEAELKEMRLRKGCYGDVDLPRAETLEIEDVEEAVSREYKAKIADIHFHGHRLGIAKSVAIELCCQLTGVSQREIARHFGYKTDAGVSKQRRVLRDTMRGNPEVDKRIKKIKKKLSQSIK